MVLIKAKCDKCNEEDDIEDFVFDIFPEAKFICLKCKKPMVRATETWLEKYRKEEMSKHPNDPRLDLVKDAHIWKEILFKLWEEDKELYHTFHGLRCAGSSFSLKNDSLLFHFSTEFTEEQKTDIKTKYINPRIDFMKSFMVRVAKVIKSKKNLTDCPF